MANYSFLERKIAFFLSKFPFIKLLIKKIYQKTNYFLYKKKYTQKCRFQFYKITKDDASSFFGYYDKSPINVNNKFIIFQSTTAKTTKIPDPNISVELVLYDVSSGAYTVIDQVFSYNWQQGCKLMWLSENRFIYNNYDKTSNAYISKIYDIKTKLSKTINKPIYDCFKEEFALSLNFERLNVGRGDYAYSNKSKTINWNDNDADGLFYIDLKSCTSKLLVSITQAISINQKATMKNATHKFNHIMLSPNGSKAMFIHRWFTPENRRYDALLVCNIDGSELKVVANDSMVSHCYWYNETTIFAYLRDNSIGNKYFFLDINSLNKKEAGKGIIDLFGDGHPSIYKHQVLFDTYPDKSRMKHLFIFDIKTSVLKEIGEFYESFDYYAETRCDLHPRFSFDGKKIFFDSVHEGNRYLYMMDI